MRAEGFDGTRIISCAKVARPRPAGRRRLLLWPAWAWKVLLPEPRPRRFDVFQTAVLKLCQAGLCKAEDMARRLGLTCDLLGFVLLQLQQMGLLDEQGRPSLRAIKLLDEDDEPPQVDAVGHVFTDALDGALWPRFHHGDLGDMQGEIHWDRGTADLLLGDPGDPRREWALLLRADRNAEPARPSALAILRAARLHRRRLTNHLLARGDVEGAARAATPAPPGQPIRLVRQIGQAQPVFVLTWAFVPRGEPAWRVWDPFGLGESEELRARLERRAERDSRLHKKLEELIGEANQVRKEDRADLARQERARAQERLGSRLGPGLAHLPVEVVEHLLAAEENLGKAAQLLGAGQRGMGRKRIDDFLGRAYAALEEVFGAQVAAFSKPEHLAPLTWQTRTNRRLLLDLAGRLGLDVDPGGPGAGLLDVTRGQVKGAIEHGNRALPGRLAAALLAARGLIQHPLRALARGEPHMLDMLARLKALRDRASHHAGESIDLSDAEAAAQDLFRLMGAMVPGAPSAAPERGPVTVHAEAVELMARLRAQASRQVDQRLPEAADTPTLRVRLIDAQEIALDVAHLRAEAADLLPDRLRDFAMAAGIVVEGALALFDGDAPSSLSEHQVPDDRNALALQARRAAQKLGFSLASDGALPPELARVRPDRVQRALSGGETTLAARTLALLLRAAKDPDHSLRQIAAAAPDALVEVAAIAALRGHGEGTTLDADDVEGVMDRVYRLAGATLQAHV